MKCASCGKELAAGAKFCPACGTSTAPAPIVPEPTPEPVPEFVYEPAPEPTPIPEFVYEPAPEPAKKAAPAPVIPAPVAAKPEVKLLGPWGYFGLQILFSIPVIGFILLIVFSFDNSHLNRRNFARSYWCGLIIWLILIVVLFVILAATGVLADLSELIQSAM